MLPPDSSPLHSLTLEIRAAMSSGLRHGIRSDVMAWRARIWATVTAEIEAHIRASQGYDPMDDCRVKLATEWLEILDGKRQRITHGLDATIDFVTGKLPPLSFKEIAAGEALAQGS